MDSNLALGGIRWLQRRDGAATFAASMALSPRGPTPKNTIDSPGRAFSALITVPVPVGSTTQHTKEFKRCSLRDFDHIVLVRNGKVGNGRLVEEAAMHLILPVVEGS
jgi:hypothetical protein